MIPRRNERGAALLTVLMLVAVMSVVAAVALERLTLATRLAANSGALDQARAYAIAAETISIARVGDLKDRDKAKTTLAGGWHGRTTRLPIPGGIATARVTDGGNCFNLNSVVAGDNAEDLKVRPIAVSQFTALMELFGIAPREAATVAVALADWIDSDSIPQPGGAEDEYYAQYARPYRTANRMMADASELRSVAGVSPRIYAAIRPWICALPVTDLSPINVNTLAPEQAPLLAMLIPGQLTIERARQMLAQRPADGYGSLNTFLDLLQSAGFTLNGEAQEQLRSTTRFFRVDIMVELGDAEVNEQALIDAEDKPARLTLRQWGEAG